MIDYDPYPGIKGPSGILSDRNYIEVNASVTLIKGGLTLTTLPFNYIQQYRQFIPASTQIEWGKVDEIQLTVDVSYRIHDTKAGSIFDAFGLIGTGTYKIRKSYQVNYSGETATVVASYEKDLGSAPGDLSEIVVAVAFADGNYTPDEGVQRLVVILKTACDTSASELSFGLDVKGVGVNVPLMKGWNKAHKKDYEFNLYYLIYGKPKRVVTVPESVLAATIWGYPEDGDSITGAQIERLEDKWWSPIEDKHPRLAEAIRTGKCVVSIKGYASTTSNRAHNMDLSWKRANSVAAAIRKMASQSVNIALAGRGDLDATTKGKSDQERRVEVSLDRKAVQPYID